MRRKRGPMWTWREMCGWITAEDLKDICCSIYMNSCILLAESASIDTSSTPVKSEESTRSSSRGRDAPGESSSIYKQRDVLPSWAHVWSFYAQINSILRQRQPDLNQKMEPYAWKISQPGSRCHLSQSASVEQLTPAQHGYKHNNTKLYPCAIWVYWLL